MIRKKRDFLIMAILLYAAPTVQARVFTRLSQAEAYALYYSEKVEPDNKDWVRPDFSSAYTERKPNFLQRLAANIGFTTNKFDMDSFKSLIRKITKERKKYGCDKEMPLEKVQPAEGDRFMIWCDLQGAFHSLLRDLSYLKSQGVINDYFKILKPNYYFVFNGNIVGGSAFQFEMLTLLLQLMNVNPKKIFYTKGMEERRWHNFALFTELKVRVGKELDKLTEIRTLIDNFFSTLPFALYLTHEVPKELQVVVIGNNDYVRKHLARNYLGQLGKDGECPGFFEYEKPMKISDEIKKISVLSFITGEDRSLEYRKTKGLTMGGTVAGALSWVIFSSPTTRSQTLYRFFYDAFAELVVQGNVNEWSISLINQQLPDKKGFVSKERYNLTTAESVNEEASIDTQLILGATLDLSRVARSIGKKIQEGLILSFYEERARDSVPGVVIKLITADDEYSPRKTRREVERLLEEKKIDIFIGSQGSATLESYLDLIKAGKIVVLFPYTGAPLFRKPELKNIIHYRGSYEYEGEALLAYALDKLKSKKIAIVYQNDVFGRGALKGAQNVIKKHGVKNVVEIPFARQSRTFSRIANQIEKANPDTIIFFTLATAIRGIIHRMGVEYFVDRRLLGLSVYEDAFERFLKDKGLRFILTRVVPDPHRSDLEIAKEYRELADMRNVPYDKISFEEFINAQILFEILRNIKGPITKEKIIAFAETMKKYPLKGLMLNFNPQTRELSDTLWLDPGEGEWIKQSTTRPPEQHSNNPQSAPIASEQKPLSEIVIESN